jgi:hypothetical protein
MLKSTISQESVVPAAALILSNKKAPFIEGFFYLIVHGKALYFHDFFFFI